MQLAAGIAGELYQSSLDKRMNVFGFGFDIDIDIEVGDIRQTALQYDLQPLFDLFTLSVGKHSSANQAIAMRDTGANVGRKQSAIKTEGVVEGGECGIGSARESAAP
jgi:hypothetical protein